MRLKFIAEDDEAVQVSTVGKITAESFDPQQDPLATMFGPEVYGKQVLLNMEESEYLDSSGIGWLLKCHKRFTEAGGRMVIHSMSPFIANMLKMLRMNQVLHLATDLAAARKSLAGDTP